jgi:hypothetical protein
MSEQPMPVVRWCPGCPDEVDMSNPKAVFIEVRCWTHRRQMEKTDADLAVERMFTRPVEVVNDYDVETQRAWGRFMAGQRA